MPHPGIEDIYVLSPVQEGMLFHTLYDPAAGTYQDQVVLDLAGPVDVRALESAWRGLVARHPSLRTTFQWEGLEKPVQVVRRPDDAPTSEIVRLDWSAARSGVAPDEPSSDERLAAWLAEDRRRGFDLERGPLLRLALIRLADDEHRLVWSYHHIVLDAWSGSIVFRELFTLYAGAVRGVEPPLPPPVPYRRYITWLRGQDPEAARAFWRRQLADLEDPARLPERSAPGDAPDMAETTLVVGASALSAFARAHRLTLATVVSGAWALALAAASGGDDVVFGTTVSGRPPDLPEVESIVGLLINTLPVRVRVRQREPIVDWLRRLQAIQSEMRRYEYSSLAEVQDQAPDGTGDGHGLFQTLLAFENVPGAELTDGPDGAPDGGRDSDRAPGAARVVASHYVFRTHYPLAVQVLPGDRLTLRLAYDRRRLATTTVVRLRDRLAALLEALPERGGDRVDALPRLGAAERQVLEVEWAGSSAPYPRERSVPDLVTARCEAAPDAVAVVQGGRHLSYGALDRASAELAHRLVALGVGLETRVGVALPRSPELIVALLAVLRAGGAYVALDAEYPRERLAYLAEDSGMEVLLTRDGRLRELAGEGLRVLDLSAPENTPEDGADRPPSPAPPPRSGSSSLAYVAYTSGSTGQPKGVAAPHRAIVRLVCGTDYLRFADDEVFFQQAPVAFDASTFEIWGALVHGARLVVAPPDLLSLERIEDETRRHGVTAQFLTTGLFQQIVEERPEILAGPRQVLTGGEAGSPRHFEAALAAMPPGTRLVHAYGPTENTTFSTTDPYVAGSDPVVATTPIGRPIANGTCHVVDGALRTAPLGAPGELVLGGDGLARGYLGRPRETAERFVPDPFGRARGGRLYRSGDRVRLLDDGRIEFLGRLDQQVKVRGFRIEPREVEAALLSHPLVRSAVVVARDDAPGGRALVAYVVPAPEAPRDGLASSVLHDLRDHLPAFAVPGHLVPIDHIPLKPQGKVDRAALPAPVPGVTAAEPRPPRTPVERTVAGLWSELLGVEEPSLDDDFFAAGGHSLLATRLVSRVRRAFDVDLPLETLFREPTLGAVATWVEHHQGGEDGTGAAAEDREPSDLRPHDHGESAPLSFAQERLWFLDRLQPGSAAYNVPLALGLDGPLDPAALDGAWTETVRRHATLRTRFLDRDGEPRQVALPPRRLHLPRTDLSHLPAPRREAVARELATREAQRPFDLTAGRPARGRLLRLAPQRHVLLLTLHHAVSDGWSLGVLLDELTSHYRALATGAPSGLPALPVQYADYAIWQRRRLQGELLEREVAYWRRRLEGAPASLDLPADHARPAIQRFRGGTVRLRLDEASTAALEKAAAHHHCTLFTLLLAAYGTFLARHGRQRDLTIGVPIAGRTRVELEHLIGFFVNTLVLRLDLDGDPTFAELLAQARDVTLGAQAYQELPFEKLTAELQPHRDLSRNPLFQTLFAYENTPAPRWDLPDLALRPLEIDVPVSKLDLELSLAVDDGALTGALTYDTDLFERTTARRLAGHMTGLLEGLAAAPAAGLDVALSALPMVPSAERHQVLREWNDPRPAAPRAPLLHRWIAARADETPDRVAVTTPNARLTYGELARRVRSLAQRFAALGIGPEAVVGVALPRSPDLVVSLLAVLEAGGAYLPLDPSYPADRLAFMLDDAAATAVLVRPGGASALPAGSYRVIEIDRLEPADPDADAGPDRQAPLPADSLAYLIYTSGSTGRPKGVAITHANATDLLAWALQAFPPEVWDGVLATTSIAFDLSVFELFAPLAAGGTVVLAESALDLLDGPTAHSVRLINTVPSAIRELLAAGGVPPGVIGVNLAGEPLQRSLVEAIHRAAPGVQVRNLYGPSEDTTYSTWETLPAGSGEMPGIGRPVAGTRALVLGDGLRPVPQGAAGELHLAGVGVGRGYLRRPALTAERFVPDPWGDGGRMYRTGDLARYRADGRLEFVGRIDHQIKSRGFRIEPGEIESVLTDHPAVRAAVVVPWEDSAGHRVPVAYVVYDRELSDLRGYLERLLPAYMVPTAIVPLDQLPLTPSGKVDRRALPAPGAIAGGDRRPVAPRTDLERRIAALWSDVLGRSDFGVRDNFFELGGHSLLVVRVHSRLRRDFDAPLTVMEMFQYPTIEALAHRLESAGTKSSFEHADDRAARKRAALSRRRRGR